MEHVLQEELWKFCLIYIDDIIIFSSGFEEHLQHIDKVFQRLTEANLKLKASKCNIARESATFLGHIVTRDGIKPNQENLSAVRSYPISKNVKQKRSFLGLVYYYRRFIKNFSKIALIVL